MRTRGLLPHLMALALVVLFLSGCRKNGPPPTPMPTKTSVPIPAVALTPHQEGRVFAADNKPYRAKYVSGEQYLVVEVLDDDLVHFELSAIGPGPEPSAPIYTSPMVFKTDYNGPSRLDDDGFGTIETPDLRVAVNAESLCVTLTDKTRTPELELTTLCPHQRSGTWTGISLTPQEMQHVYGLGEQFIAPGSPDGDWVGRVRSPGNEYGNALDGFSGGGHVGNAQFPVLYALGEGYDNYALFLDHVYRQDWDFTGEPWTVSTQGDQIRWYLMTGPDLPDLRQDYMALVGHPPVPPPKMFGLWVSEYGFDDWNELLDKLQSLQVANLPVDGFVLDLPWFGGLDSSYFAYLMNSQADSGSASSAPPLPTVVPKNSQVGSLTWDEASFPHPTERIARLRDEYGVGVMVMEQSYISQWLPEHDALTGLGYLVRDCADGDPSLLQSWWGWGGMIDWTNPAAADYWHDVKRQPLIEAGVMAHWTDLGEPEVFEPEAWYYGFPVLNLHRHRDVHNLYNLLWSESIHRGYARHKVTQRPFILSRSGTSGSQRFGVSMWSADIGSNLTSLAAHLNVQMHMAFSGMDYFGADIGGFYRSGLERAANLDEMYTIWFAHGTAFDVPVRPHTFNLCNCHQTAPDRIGDLDSNRANLRQRYALSPYLYSLAHRAYLFGEPVIPSLAYYYQTDDNVREMGSQKLIGRDLLVATVTEYGQAHTAVYLPAGSWINYHTHERFDSPGEWVTDVPLFVDGAFRLPLFARAGAIVPQMYVDEETMNVLGKRRDGSTRDELILRVYADNVPSSFTLFEDDGETVAYQHGELRTTEITQQTSGDKITVTIHPALGTYVGAPTARDNLVYLVTDGADVTDVTLNGAHLSQHSTLTAFEAANSGWHLAGGNLVLAKSGQADVTTTKLFEFAFTD